MRKFSIGLILLTLLLAVSAMAYTRFTRLEGEIVSIDYAAKTLVVGETEVYTTDATQILNCGEAATFDDLAVGQYVKVVGEEADGRFIAKRICIKPTCDGTGPKGGCRQGCCPCR